MYISSPYHDYFRDYINKHINQYSIELLEQTRKMLMIFSQMIFLKWHQFCDHSNYGSPLVSTVLYVCAVGQLPAEPGCWKNAMC